MLMTPLTFWLALAAGVGTPKASTDTAVFAGGCFWGIEGVFEHTRGVISATAGYAGGHTPSPSYEEVSSGETGHAEAVRVVYDPAQVTYGQLLAVFFTVAHDPTELDRQGPDVGTNYRSIAFYRDSTQHAAIDTFIAELQKRRLYSKPVVTEVIPLATFYEAEGYHQHYMEHHPDQPYIAYNDAPKVVHLKEAFPALYRDSWK
jgi:peptide-methionine (S)-S-oxide reductase